MTYAWYIYPLAILAGIVAGIINTLAGSGSLVTLPMLVFLIPGHSSVIANATNRVGITIQNIVGITTFQRSGRLNLTGGIWLVGPAVPGAVIGAWIASRLGKQQMDIVIGVVMLIMLFVILYDPQRWLREHSVADEGRPSIWTLLLFFALALYGGFIQAGVGVFILATMVLGLGYSLVHANAIKLMIVLAITFSALVIFVQQGQVIWKLGILMAIGQSSGAWLAARFATSNKNANIWVRRLLIAVIVVSIIKFFGIYDLVDRIGLNKLLAEANGKVGMIDPCNLTI